MATQAIWVHGNEVRLRWPGGKGDPVPGNHTEHHCMDGVEDAALRTRIEWTDVVGYPGDNGITFTGRPAFGSACAISSVLQ